jgi:vacuolar protein sorting-associated protein VTA1
VETFRAAAAFFDLLGIWQKPLNAELASKSKYAKYHALRIAKAIKAGEDPNLSNPAPEVVTSPPPLDPNDPEVQRIRSLQPTVEDINDSSHQPSFRPPVSTSSPAIQSFSQPQTGGDVSPLESEQPGDGYFPHIPKFAPPNEAPPPPTAAADITTPPPAETTSSPEPRDFYNTNISQQPAPSPPVVPSKFPSQPPVVPQASAFQPFVPAPAALVPPAQQGRATYIVDDEAILSAQKHAKWAISALNFEDVDTAVQELRIALQSLGAS